MERGSSLTGKLSALSRRNGNGRSNARDKTRATVSTDELSAKLSFLRETDVFAALSSDETDWLSKNTTMMSCPPGRVFYTPDDPGEVLYILKRGTVNLYRLTGDGRKLVVARLDAQTVFGDMGLVGQAMHGCFAEAAGECLICVLSRNDVQTLIRSNPDVALAFLSEMGHRLRQREEALESFAFRSVPARLASFLQRESDAYGVVSGYSHEEIAQMIGTYRETVSQVLGKFRAAGIVSVEPRRIRVLDVGKLEVQAES